MEWPVSVECVRMVERKECETFLPVTGCLPNIQRSIALRLKLMNNMQFLKLENTIFKLEGNYFQLSEIACGLSI